MIEVSEFDSCWTIVFLNKSHEKPTPTVWVCVNKEAMDRHLARLKSQHWIEVVESGPSHVAR